MTPRRRLKTLLQRRVIGGPPIICASLGRSGSTLVNDALVAGRARAWSRPLESLGALIVRDWLWKLDEDRMIPGAVYKTHDLPDALTGRSGARAVFVFGSVVDAAISTASCHVRFGDAWMRTHLQHLNATCELEHLYDGDGLRFAEQIASWTSFTRIPVLCLRFERLWENQAALEGFVGYPVRLPPKRERVSGGVAPDEAKRWAEEVYGELDERISRLPDAFLAGPSPVPYAAAE